MLRFSKSKIQFIMVWYKATYIFFKCCFSNLFMYFPPSPRNGVITLSRVLSPSSLSWREWRRGYNWPVCIVNAQCWSGLSSQVSSQQWVGMLKCCSGRRSHSGVGASLSLPLGVVFPAASSLWTRGIPDPGLAWRLRLTGRGRGWRWRRGVRGRGRRRPA